MTDDSTNKLLEAVRAVLDSMSGPYPMYGTSAGAVVYEADPQKVAELRALVPPQQCV